MATPKSDQEAEDILSPEEARQVYSDALTVDSDAFREKIALLRQNAPQLLHIEGGSIAQRIAFAHYWIALHICQNQQSFNESIEQVSEEKSPVWVPCLECPECCQVGARRHADALFYDGNQDSIKIEEMRHLKALIGEAPRFAPKRVVALLEAHNMRHEAANALLKLLEEPSEHTLFVFTTPQRERLLPTLISRGFVLTLPWQDSEKELSSFEKEWDLALADFFRDGTGIFVRTSPKGAIDNTTARIILVLIEKSLSHALVKRNHGSLSGVWPRLNAEGFNQADEILARAHEALQYQTNPTYIIESMLTELYTVLHP